MCKKLCEFYPNGGLCLSCKHLLDDCSDKPFEGMRVIKVDKKDGTKMVICTDYVKKG